MEILIILLHCIFRANGTQHLCMSETCPQRRKLSFSQEADNEPAANISKIPLKFISFFYSFKFFLFKIILKPEKINQYLRKTYKKHTPVNRIYSKASQFDTQFSMN